KQAIDAIAARDAEIGYSLAELFGTGRIDVPVGPHPTNDPQLFYFTFDQQWVVVDKNSLFNEGLAAIEQPLIVKYGEMAKKLALFTADRKAGYATASQTIREAGLHLLVRHELDRALQQRDRQGGGAQAAATDVLEQLRGNGPEEALPRDAADPRVLFHGAVNADDPAFYMALPYTREALMQVADLQLPFFSVRFVLRCLRNGTAPHLFACLVNGAIAGLVYLGFKSSLFYKGLEIKYIASAQHRPEGVFQTRPVHRGVGTFLMAGTWLLWKNYHPGVREILLDSEIQASSFYESIGFEKRRPYVYSLTRPAGRLTYALAVMVDRSRTVSPAVLGEMAAVIKDQVRLLARSKPADPRRELALHFLKLCLLSRSRPDLARSAAQGLLKYKSRVPESTSLLELGTAHGRITLVDLRPAAASPLLVFQDSAMQSHLKGIFHLESANRLKAMDDVLAAAELSGCWKALTARPAGKEELAWVHTPAHIARIAATAGRQLYAIDLDTQTTSASYDVACLAVGGIFNLLDAVMAGPSRRGFAAVRPPGHHAEPDKAMGFCLFNNAALAACYLKHAHGAKRVMIVDIDAHHGNGTQAAFVQSRDVLFFSMHQFPCYPGTGNYGEVGQGPGEGYSVNVPLDKGMGDSEFGRVIQRLVDPLARAYEPDMLLVSCGFDLYQHDRLAGLNGTPAGYAMLTRQLCRIADTVCGGRIAFLMEGGYSVQGIRECGRSVIQELCGLPSMDAERLEKMAVSSTPFAALQKSIAIQARYWSILKGC
ncbi:MAG: histone deacetylase, partial [Desulfobacterales bacterium]|nr:histone deacetylase [Desulfobacterales bacterium]